MIDENSVAAAPLREARNNEDVRLATQPGPSLVAADAAAGCRAARRTQCLLRKGKVTLPYLMYLVYSEKRTHDAPLAVRR